MKTVEDILLDIKLECVLGKNVEKIFDLAKEGLRLLVLENISLDK